MRLLISLRANEEIAQVRSKASSESMALTASLRKEQMKNESLEQALQQKVTGVLVFLHANSRLNLLLAIIHDLFTLYVCAVI